MKSGLWKSKRNRRLNLDNNTCQICGYKGKGLEIHNESGYILIPNEPLTCLKTLCRECHQDQHDVFDILKPTKIMKRGTILLKNLKLLNNRQSIGVKEIGNKLEKN